MTPRYHPQRPSPHRQGEHRPSERFSSWKKLAGLRMAHELPQGVIMEGPVQLLYVDDDENDCILISESLHQLCDHCILSCAATPEQALDRLTQTRGTESFPHLVITDGSLRTGGGSTGMIEAIHRHYPLLPVLVFSGNPMQQRVDQFYAAGANGFIYKGVGIDDFSTRLAQLLAHWTKMLILPSRPN